MATCLLCGEERRLTQEHAPPRWTKDAFFRRYPELELDIRRERHGKEFSAPHFSESAYAPCEDCRNWWNDNFEHRVRHLVEPLIFGEPVVVPLEHVTAVSTWIGYQSMIRSIAAGDTEFGRFPDKDFRFIRENGRLPDDHVLWIACRASLITIEHDPAEVEPWDYTPRCPGVFSTIMNLTCRHHLGVERANAASHEGEESGALIRVSPTAQAFEWPPTTLLDRETYLKLKYVSRSSRGD